MSVIRFRGNALSIFVATSILLTLGSAPLRAVTYTWDPLPKTTAGDGLITGGYGTWTTSTANRNWTIDGGLTNGPWVNGNASAAVFQNTGGYLTTTTALTANSLTFAADGYSIQNNSQITLAGTAPFISIPSSGHQAEIRNLNATAGFTLTGSGTLTASLSATAAGTITVDPNATLKLTNNVASGFLAIPSSVAFAGSGTIQIANVNEAYDSTPTGTNLPASSPAFSGKLQILNSYTSVTIPVAIGNGSIETLGYSQVTFDGTTGVIYPTNITLNSIASTSNGEGSAGTLHLTGSNPTLTGTITLARDSRITSYTVNGNIRGTIQESGGARVLEIGGSNRFPSGANTLTLSGTTTHTGGTVINGTIFNGSGSTTVLTLDYSTNNSSKFLDNSSFTSQGSNVLTLSGATGNHTEVVGQFNNLGALTINRSGANTAKIALGAMKNSGVLNVTAANLATTTTPNNSLGYLPGVVFNDTQLAANDGAGNIVAASLTYTTLTRLSSGSKVIPSAPNSIVRIIDGSGLSGANFSLSSAVTDIGSLLQTATGSINLTVDLQTNTLRLAANGEIISQADRTLTLTPGFLTAGGANNTPGTVTIRSNNSQVVINASIRDNGTAPVAVVTGGNVTLGPANTFSGGLTIAGGTMTVTTLAALGTNNLITLDGGRLSLNVATPTLTKDVFLTANGGHIGSGNSILAGTISGPGALTLSGNTLTTVTGQNSYTGGTNIVGLQVAVGANTAALGTGPISVRSGTLAGGNFYATGGIWANDFRISGEYQVRGAIRLANATLQGNIELEGNSGIYTDVNDLPGTVNGVISGPYNFRKSGKGQLTLSGTNTYTGSTTIDGTLAITGTGSIGNGDYHNDFLIVDSFATATLSYESATNQIIRGRVWTSGNLIKSGSSTLTVMGDINADITVNGGKLLINGVGSGIDTTFVNAGTLGGAGSLPGIVTIQNGGTLSPGNSIESFHVANVVLNAGSIFDYELTTSNLQQSDLLVANGNVTIDGATLNLVNLTVGNLSELPLGSKLTLINYSGTLTGSFASLTDGTTFQYENNTWQINYADTMGGNNLSGEQVYSKFVTLTTVAIPEPSTYALALTLLGSFFVYRKRSQDS